MATVIRPPIITNNRPKIDGTHLRQFVSAGLALLTAVALPVGQARHTNVGFDIPKPRVDHNQERQFASPGLSLRLATTPAFRTIDWRIPHRAPPRAPETPPLNIAALNTVVAATKPFLLSDWALPQKFRPGPPDATWSESLALSVANQSPILDVLFSRPPLRSVPLAPDTAFANLVPLYTVVVTTAPFSQTDWPLPKKGLLDLPDTSWASSLTLLAPKPFLQSDWQLPQKFRPDPPDVTYSESLAISFAGQPFVQSDWPLAKKSLPAPPIYSSSESLALTFTGQPFALRDWPLSVLSRPSPESQVQNIATLRTVVAAAKPFLQLGWDLPRRIDSPLARDRQRQNDLARQTAVRLPAQPYDWPAPKGRRLPTPDTIYGTPQQFKSVAPAIITLAATEAQDTGAFNLSFWRVEPIPPDGWTPETPAADTWTAVPFTAAGWIREFVPGAGPVLQFVNNAGDLIKFVNNNGDEIIFTANQVDIWNAEAASSDTWTKRNG
jgi:hypothetical protein